LPVKKPKRESGLDCQNTLPVNQEQNRLFKN
jgi:hypothetical protein